ncbi:unnamed protein product [Amoebophrya sp. A120]|nr:unnamed protein product [Amoebophrya sp. A120]|eukprot:GSA120T00023155001.1
MFSPTRADDLRTLGLPANGTTSDTQAIKRAYHRLALTCHPDKGGKKEDFQKVFAAHERLLKQDQACNFYGGTSSTATTSASSSSSSSRQPPGSTASFSSSFATGTSAGWHFDPDEHNHHFDRHCQFFAQFLSRHSNDFYFFDGAGFDEFDSWDREDRRVYARQRAENVKNHYDKRDRKPKRESAFTKNGNLRKNRTTPAQQLASCCQFCPDENNPKEGITARSATSHGLNWHQYSSHPQRLRTCWACKSAHISVMTEKMARVRFARKLDDPSGAVFARLRRENKFFTHTPQLSDRNTRTSTFFWVPDLEAAALQLGWKPRGEAGIRIAARAAAEQEAAEKQQRVEAGARRVPISPPAREQEAAAQRRRLNNINPRGGAAGGCTFSRSPPWKHDEPKPARCPSRGNVDVCLIGCPVKKQKELIATQDATKRNEPNMNPKQASHPASGADEVPARASCKNSQPAGRQSLRDFAPDSPRSSLDLSSSSDEDVAEAEPSASSTSDSACAVKGPAQKKQKSG